MRHLPHRSGRRQPGYTLVELLLVLGACATGAAAIYGTYQMAAQHLRERGAMSVVQATVGHVTAAFAASPDYRLLNQQSALEQGFFGPDVAVDEGRALAPWGGEMTLVPADWLTHGRRVPAGAFQLLLYQVPGALCTPLAAQMGADAVLVNGRAVERSGDGRVDPAMAAAACNGEEATLALVYARRESSAAALELCRPPHEPQEQAVDCPAGRVGQQQRLGHCTGPYGEVVWDAWTVAEDSCTPCPTSPEAREAACPPSQFGSRNEERRFDCSTKAWGDWEVTHSTCQDCPTEETALGACAGGGQAMIRRIFFCLEGRWGPWAPAALCPDGRAPMVPGA